MRSRKICLVVWKIKIERVYRETKGKKSDGNLTYRHKGTPCHFDLWGFFTGLVNNGFITYENYFQFLSIILIITFSYIKMMTSISKQSKWSQFDCIDAINSSCLSNSKEYFAVWYVIKAGLSTKFKDASKIWHRIGMSKLVI